ncbi:MAG: divergent polysaccharide deacetylase family protein [Candidatus Midichloria sp.]|nr:divergent polysaccharide deacetylase family protein [Candidatus Midichloria sp.]
MKNLDLKKVDRHLNHEDNDRLHIYIFWCFIIVFIVAGVFLFFSDTKEKTEDKSPISILSPTTAPSTNEISNDYEGKAINIMQEKNNIEPAISVVIANLGLNKKGNEWVYNLPKEVVLGFSPYADEISGLIDEADRRGYETILHIPMQPANYPFVNLGPYCLLDSFDDKENISRTDAVLAKSSKIKGVYTNPDEVFTESESDLKTFLNELNFKSIGRSKFLFLYHDEKVIKQIDSYAKSLGLPRVVAEKIDISVSDDVDLKELKKNFQYAESIAKSRGGAIILIYSDTNYTDHIFEWLSKLSKSGIKLIPIDTLFKRSRDHDHKEEILFMINDKKNKDNSKISNAVQP